MMASFRAPASAGRAKDNHGSNGGTNRPTAHETGPGRSALRASISWNLDLHVPSSADPSLKHECHWAWALEAAASEPLIIHILAGTREFPLRPPRADELFLWFGVPQSGTLPRLLALLAASERVAALRRDHDADRLSFAAARLGLRALLARAMGRAPQDVTFVRGAHGKPALSEPPSDAPWFSASHTRGLVAIAIAGRRVGVDIERHRVDGGELMQAAKAAFAPEALVALAEGRDERAREGLFFRFWTLGEAFMKATGEGLAQGPKTFAFTPRGVPSLLRVDASWGPRERWRFGVS